MVKILSEVLRKRTKTEQYFYVGKRSHVVLAICMAAALVTSNCSFRSLASSGVGGVLEKIVEGEDSETDDISEDANSEGESSESEENTAESENAASQENVSENKTENSGSSASESSFANGKNSDSMNTLPEALCCSFVVPANLKASDSPGVYVNEHYPLESANVTYKMVELPKEKVLTNAEKAKGEDNSDSTIEFRYDELTSEMYETIQKENYEALYGSDINFTMESFENINLNGFPGYKIKMSYTPAGTQPIHQTSFIMLSKNKVFTIVYSRADDDDFEEAFAESMETINIK